MKKNAKFFTFALFTFFISSVSVFAKEMTIDELGEEASKIEKDAGYIYVLGEYAFTSNYDIKQEALIIAATSVKLEDPTDLSQANIYQIVRKRDAQTFEPKGWEKGENVLGKKDMSTKVNVKYIDMHRILETSEATISADVENSKYSTYKDVLKQYLNFTTENFYGKNDKVKIENNKVKGLLLKKSNTDLYFNDDDNKKYADTEYYFATIVEVPEANENTIITITNLNGETKKATWKEFDVQSGTPGIVILLPINKKDWDDSADKQIIISVDVDGDITKNEYAATEYKLDLSELKFQQESKMDLTTEKLPEADVKSISSNWGYTKSTSDTYKLAKVEGDNKYKLTGTIVQQKINDSVFPEDERTDFYFLFNIGQNIDKSLFNKAIVTFPGNKNTKTTTITDETGVTILFSTKEDKKSEPIKITVDLDGDGDEYYPVTYEIDLSDVIFEKSSKFSILEVENGGLAENPLESIYGWEKPDNYSVKFNTDGTTVKVTGLLPILETFADDKNPFGEDDTTGYYLPFVIKTDAGKKNENADVTVQFIHDGEDTKTFTADNFDGEDVLYILRHLDKDAKDKTFKIVVDMDGDGTGYAPYEITFDWSELDFQYKSKVADTIIVDPSATSSDTSRGYISEQNKKDTEAYGYDFDNVGDITIEKEGLYGYKLTGTVKEQDVEKGGFKETTGYYVPVKIYGPTIADAYGDHFLSQTDGRKRWTIFLHDEAGKYREITPSQDDYNNGYIVVLFKLKNDADKKITYKIDWDGSEGNVFLEQEVTISYGELNYQALNTITYNYKDAEGKEQTESTKIYQNEEATLKDITGINSDYRKFDGWYKSSDNSKVSESTLTIAEDKDETLTAHWTLDADAFVKAVIDDLNNPESEISEDYSEKFEITMGEDNTITIDVSDSRLLLKDMNDTTIPGAIAYVLQMGEIKDITLATEDKKVEFTKDGDNNTVVSKVSLDEKGTALKEKIKNGAQALFKEVLSDAEATMTLSKMALDNKSFTLEIGENVETVTLINSENKNYTFNFKTEAITVTNESELEKALSNVNISHIYLGNNIEVTKQHTINREVTINGENIPGVSNYKISVKSEKQKEVNSIFKVTAPGVTIDNIELSDVSQAIIVDGEGATLTTTGLKLTNISQAGIEVVKGSLTAKEVTFDEESHDVPTARIQKENKKTAKVSIARATENNPNYIGVVLHRDGKWCQDDGENYGKTNVESCKKTSLYDEWKQIEDTFYYLNNSNIKKYKIVGFMGVSDSMWVGRIYEEGEKIGSFDAYFGKEKITVDGTELYFVGYGSIRRTDKDLKEGSNYSELITDIANETVGTRNWYFANFAEKDASKTVSIENNSTYSIDTKQFDTYKFKDKPNGMTIGDLRKIDKEFDKALKKLESIVLEGKNKLQYKKGTEMAPLYDLTDSTTIDEKLTLVITEVAK